ncbi:unnamed protein product [Parascedosporium putredinis]|uniref:Mitochondrial inner membrane protease subunit 2 n=1 Tax=Parascedosporium putredinis TaxID=1442378 RepID=A0A9P1GUR6_9PEZI|nr:unnamed protein product [Parascedosporium putredinis]CAI7987750.1 unnamed protein product [Parascedosporium putredinis]
MMGFCSVLAPSSSNQRALERTRQIKPGKRFAAHGGVIGVEEPWALRLGLFTAARELGDVDTRGDLLQYVCGGNHLYQGGSMYPFLNGDKDSTLRSDAALNWKLYPHLGLARGMIVTFKYVSTSVQGILDRSYPVLTSSHPAWQVPLDPEKTAVKRIVGLEGDLVWSRHASHYDAIRVPKGHIWVEGDAGNDKESLDSNTYGPISVRLVTVYICAGNV